MCGSGQAVAIMQIASMAFAFFAAAVGTSATTTVRYRTGAGSPRTARPATTGFVFAVETD